MTNQLKALKLTLAMLTLAWIAGGGPASFGATIDLQVTAALDLVSVVYPEVEMVSSPRVLTSLEIPLPPVTLTGGDTIRVAIDFAGGQYFQRIAPPAGGYAAFNFGLSLKNEPPASTLAISGLEASKRVDWFDAQGNLALQSQPASSFHVEPTTKDLWGAEILGQVDSNFAEPTPQTGSKLVFEWTLPTQIPVHLALPDPPAFGTRTFSNNSVKLLFDVISPSGQAPLPHAAVAVPEPTAWWLGVAACAGLLAYRPASRQTAS